MTTFASYARVDAEGRLHLNDDLHLMEGEEVMVTIERVTPEQLAKEDEIWDELFARAPEVLERLVAEAMDDIANGRATDCEPDDETS